jgi:hypothetical protein
MPRTPADQSIGSGPNPAYPVAAYGDSVLNRAESHSESPRQLARSENYELAAAAGYHHTCRPSS